MSVLSNLVNKLVKKQDPPVIYATDRYYRYNNRMFIVNCSELILKELLQDRTLTYEIEEVFIILGPPYTSNAESVASIIMYFTYLKGINPYVYSHKTKDLFYTLESCCSLESRMWNIITLNKLKRVLGVVESELESCVDLQLDSLFNNATKNFCHNLRMIINRKYVDL